MMKHRTLGLIFLLFSTVALLHAEDSPHGKVLNDPLLDKLIGDWNVERKMGNLRIEKNLVHAEWILQHQFMEPHYRDAATPPTYEAIVLISYDDVARRYICHWADVFGDSYSTDGLVPRDEASNAIAFKFEFHDGQLTNRYAFDAKAGTWTSTIRRTEKGEWKLFCENKLTRVGTK